MAPFLHTFSALLLLYLFFLDRIYFYSHVKYIVVPLFNEFFLSLVHIQFDRFYDYVKKNEGISSY